MADPRYEALGLAPDYAAQAADAFYGSVPQLQMRGFGGQAQPMSDQYDIQAAYEKDIASRVQAIDPRDPEYEFKIADLFTSIEDPDAPSYDRVRMAVRAGAGRAQLYRQQAAAQQKANNDIAIQAAEAGIDPEKVRSWRDANGNYDPVVAAYTIGEVKRGNTAAGRTDPTLLPAEDRRGLVELIETIQTTSPTDEEKISAFQSKYGKEPSTDAEWSESFTLARNNQLAPARARAQAFQALGINIPEEFKTMIGLTVQPSTVQSTEASQSIAPTTATTPPPVDPSSPNLSMSEAQAAERDRQAAINRTAVDSQWTLGKQSLENNLLSQFGGDRRRLQQFYRSVLKGETEADLATDAMERAAYGEGLAAQSIADKTLLQMGLNPQDRSPDLTIDRGFGAGGFVTNSELLRELAKDRSSIQPDTASQQLPRITSQAQRDALPAGSRYIDPTGQVRTKFD